MDVVFPLVQVFMVKINKQNDNTLAMVNHLKLVSFYKKVV